MAKGLEFPVVALAGFRDGPQLSIPTGAAEDERAELFRGAHAYPCSVGITRAMRHLLVAVPAGKAPRFAVPAPGRP
jgi:superfamily I DNA/RNA helicase